MNTRIATVLLLAAIAHGQAFSTLPEAPHLSTRKPSTHGFIMRAEGDPFVGDANVVHNLPAHHNFVSRHKGVFIILGGVAAGTGIGLATRGRGFCTGMYEGKPYAGNPCPKGER